MVEHKTLAAIEDIDLWHRNWNVFSDTGGLSLEQIEDTKAFIVEWNNAHRESGYRIDYQPDVYNKMFTITYPNGKSSCFTRLSEAIAQPKAHEKIAAAAERMQKAHDEESQTLCIVRLYRPDNSLIGEATTIYTKTADAVLDLFNSDSDKKVVDYSDQGIVMRYAGSGKTYYSFFNTVDTSNGRFKILKRGTLNYLAVKTTIDGMPI